MNRIIKKILLAADKFMPEMDLHIVIVDHRQKTNKEYKQLK